MNGATSHAPHHRQMAFAAQPCTGHAAAPSSFLADSVGSSHERGRAQCGTDRARRASGRLAGDQWRGSTALVRAFGRARNLTWLWLSQPRSLAASAQRERWGAARGGCGCTCSGSRGLCAVRHNSGPADGLHACAMRDAAASCGCYGATAARLLAARAVRSGGARQNDA